MPGADGGIVGSLGGIPGRRRQDTTQRHRCHQPDTRHDACTSSDLEEDDLQHGVYMAGTGVCVYIYSIYLLAR